MKTKYFSWVVAVLGIMTTVVVPAEIGKGIPYDQLGAAAGKQYTGDGLGIARFTSAPSTRLSGSPMM